MKVDIRSVPRRDFTLALLKDLHALAHRLMAEDFEHFHAHALTNDVVLVFVRADTSELAGFQFWKTTPLALPRARAIVGGKLRIAPAYRGRALHLRAGLRFYLEQQLRHPRTRFYRLSLASIFGFTSIASALADYRLFEPQPSDAETRALTAAFVALAHASHYQVDLETGLFPVRIFMTPETLAAYPEAYFAKPAARVYARVNPDFRTNGCYVGFWFRFSPRNLASLVRAIVRSARRR